MTVAEVKKLVGNKKLIVGAERTIKELKRGQLKKIFISSNCSEGARETIEINARLFKVEVSHLDVSNEELGIIMKKPFAVSVISLLQ